MEFPLMIHVRSVKICKKKTTTNKENNIAITKRR